MQTYFCLLVRKLVFLNNKECGTFFCLYIIQLLCFYRFFPKEVFWRILLVVMPATDELTSYTYIHVNLEWNCSFCVALGCTTNWTARGLTFFDDLGFSFSEMHSCLYWYACIFAYICKRFCIPCPIRRCLLPPVFDGNVASIFSLTSSILVDICWRFAPTFEAMVPCRCFDRSWHWASWPVQMQVVHEHEISKDFGWVNYGTEIHLFLQESRNPAFTLWRPPA